MKEGVDLSFLLAELDPVLCSAVERRPLHRARLVIQRAGPCI